VRELVRGRLEAVGPTTAADIARSLGVPAGDADFALGALEHEGFVLRGRFTPGVVELEWCERRLLARIHRYTLDRLRQEIEPVTAADFMRFLLEWQRAAPDARAEGPEGLGAVLELLDGYEAPAAAWEADVLPARLGDYDPLWLDGLCLSGEIAWGRLAPAGACGAVRGRDGGAVVAGAAPGSAAPGRGRRGSGRVAAAAPLRGGVPSAGDARDIAHAVARHPAGVPPARGARRDSRRALRGRVLGRAIRPAGSRGVAPPRAARGAPRGAGGRERGRPAQPGRDRDAGRRARRG